MSSNAYMTAKGTPGRATVTASMQPQDIARMRAFADERGMSISKVVQRVVSLYLTYQGAPEAAPTE